MLYVMLDSSGFGGIESHVLQLSLLLKDKKIPFKVVFISKAPNHPLYPLLEKKQIEYFTSASFVHFSLLVQSHE